MNLHQYYDSAISCQYSVMNRLMLCILVSDDHCEYSSYDQNTKLLMLVGFKIFIIVFKNKLK